jgi:hypothetical protein
MQIMRKGDSGLMVQCDRCEVDGLAEPSDDYDRTQGIVYRTYGLELCEECYGSFDAWIRCKIG